MAQYTRLKKITDPAYIATNPGSEITTRDKLDGPTQEIADMLYSRDAGKGASQIGIEGTSYADVQAFAVAVSDSQIGFIPLDLSVTDAKLATDVKVGSLASLSALLVGFTSSITVAINKIVSWVGDLSSLSTTDKTSLVASINELFTDKANKTQESFIAPTLLNSWVNFGAPTDVAGYYKDNFGNVHIKGTVKNGTTSVAIFTLPIGYRPSANEIFIVDTNTGAGRITIDNSGNLIPVGGNGYVSMAGITFRAV